MNSHDVNLKLQAYVDGKLPSGEAAEIERLLSHDASAQALCGELRRTKSAFAGGEIARPLPESREFFWSKIERQIALEAKSAAVNCRAGDSWLGWLQKRLLRVSGVALASCLLILMILSPGRENSHSGNIEIACDSMGAYTYRDQQEQMTMVWLYDRSTDDSEFTDVSDKDKVTPE